MKLSISQYSAVRRVLQGEGSPILLQQAGIPRQTSNLVCRAVAVARAERLEREAEADAAAVGNLVARGVACHRSHVRQEMGWLETDSTETGGAL
jgi:hypothetical protein